MREEVVLNVKKFGHSHLLFKMECLKERIFKLTTKDYDYEIRSPGALELLGILLEKYGEDLLEQSKEKEEPLLSLFGRVTDESGEVQIVFFHRSDRLKKFVVGACPPDHVRLDEPTRIPRQKLEAVRIRIKFSKESSFRFNIGISYGWADSFYTSMVFLLSGTPHIDFGVPIEVVPQFYG